MFSKFRKTHFLHYCSTQCVLSSLDFHESHKVSQDCESQEKTLILKDTSGWDWPSPVTPAWCSVSTFKRSYNHPRLESLFYSSSNLHWQAGRLVWNSSDKEKTGKMTHFKHWQTQHFRAAEWCPDPAQYSNQKQPSQQFDDLLPSTFSLCMIDEDSRNSSSDFFFFFNRCHSSFFKNCRDTNWYTPFIGTLKRWKLRCWISKVNCDLFGGQTQFSLLVDCNRVNSE